MGLGLFVGVWVARYLAPESYGTLNFAMAFVSFIIPLASLGLDTIVIREIVKNPSSAGCTLTSAWLLQFMAGLLAIGINATAIFLMRPYDATSQVLVVILSSTILIKSFNVFDLWFQSEVRSGPAVVTRTIALLFSAAVKVSMILNGLTVVAFAAVSVLEAALVAAGLALSFRIFATKGTLTKPAIERMVGLLKNGWPLILTGFMIIIFMRTDQLMLGQMIGDTEVGIYSAATRIAEIWYFIPMSVAASVFPALITSKQNSETQYMARLQALYSAMTWMSLAFAGFISFFSPHIVRLLYGPEYSAAAPVLTLSAWGGVFVAQGVARGKWIIIENLQHYTMWYIGGAAAINIALNLILIPKYGSQGAALASVAAQASAVIIIPLFIRPIRRSVIMLFYSFRPTAARAGLLLLSSALSRKGR